MRLHNRKQMDVYAVCVCVAAYYFESLENMVWMVFYSLGASKLEGKKTTCKL